MSAEQAVFAARTTVHRSNHYLFSIGTVASICYKYRTMYCCSILDWSMVVAQDTVLQSTLHLLYSRRMTDSGVYFCVHWRSMKANEFNKNWKWTVTRLNKRAKTDNVHIVQCSIVLERDTLRFEMYLLLAFRCRYIINTCDAMMIVARNNYIIHNKCYGCNHCCDCVPCV